MKKVLITGATGYIGSNLTKRFVDSNVQVGIIKRPNSNISRLKEIEHSFLTFDYDGSTKSLLKALSEFKPDVVFHLASSVIARHKTEEIEEMINANVLFGTQLLEAMHLTEVNKIVNTSTFWQMGERSEFDPFSLYTVLKQAFEDILLFYGNVYDIKSISLRLPDVYGPNDNRSKILNLIHNATKTGDTLKMSPGEQEMDILYIDDIIDGFIVASSMFQNTEKNFNTYSLSSRKPMLLKKVVEIYEECNGVKAKIEFGGLSYRDNEIMKIILPSNILPNWQAKVSLKEGLKRLT